MSDITCPRCARLIPSDAMICCYCGRTIVKKPPAHAHTRPNGSGYATRRGKTWTAFYCVSCVIDDGGVPRRKYVSRGGFKTKAEALAHCDVLKRDHSRKLAPTLAKYWAMYAEADLLKLSKSKQTAYAIAWDKWAALAARRIDSLTVQDIRAVVADKAPTYYTARDMKVVLQHLYDLAGADGWVNRDLPSYIILPALEEKERRPFTDLEQAALWKLYESGDRRAAIPLIMIYTGMMPGEVQDLKTDMIDLAAQRITGAGKKTKVRRESPVYLPDCIVPVLQDELDHPTGRGGYLWPRSQDAFYANYYAALEAAGCRRLEPYCCRHTTATALAVSEGVAPQTVQRIMRWSSTRMLDRYAHPDDAAVMAASNTLTRRTE